MAFVGVSIKAGVKRGWLLAGLQGEYRVVCPLVVLHFFLSSVPFFLPSFVLSSCYAAFVFSPVDTFVCSSLLCLHFTRYLFLPSSFPSLLH